MIINNVWSGLLAVIVGFIFAIAFWGPISTLINVTDSNARFFIGVGAVLVYFMLVFFVPMGHITQDDKGGSA